MQRSETQSQGMPVFQEWLWQEENINQPVDRGLVLFLPHEPPLLIIVSRVVLTVYLRLYITFNLVKQGLLFPLSDKETEAQKH